MKKNFYKTLNQLLSRMACLLVLASASFAASAAEVIITESGGSYELKFKSEWQGSFTAPSDGILTVLSPERVDFYGTDSNFEKIKEYNHSFVDDLNQMQVLVEKGKTYYFRINYVMNEGKLTVNFKASEGAKVEFKGWAPEEGSTLDVTGLAQIQANFDMQVNTTGAVLSSGTNNANLAANDFGNCLFVEYKGTLFDWLKSGSVKAGDDVTLTFSGVSAKLDKSIIYGEDGMLKGTFKAPAKPVELVSKYCPSTMKTVWAEGDAEGIVKLVFDGDLYTGDDPTLMPKAELGQGDLEGGLDYYYEVVPVKVNGKELIVDLTGKTRPVPALTGDPMLDCYTLNISNVRDANGNSVYSASQGSVGSYGFTMPFGEIADVIWEFTPASGSLDNVKTVNLWIRGISAIRYNGAKYTYSLNGVATDLVVPQSELSVEEVEEDEVEINIPVPAALTAADASSSITLTLNDLQFLSGVPANMKATFAAPSAPEEFAIIPISPREDETLAELTEGDFFKVKITQECYAEYKIIDAADGEILKDQVWLNAQGGGIYTAEYPTTYPLSDGHTYKVIVTAWPDEGSRWQFPDQTLGSKTYLIYGIGAGFEYSKVRFVGISPDPETREVIENSDFTITLTFDGEVSEVRAKQPGNYSVAYATEKASDDGKVWNVIVPQSVVEACTSKLELWFAAKDAEGLSLRGPEGIKEDSHWEYSYICTVGSPDMTVTPEGGEVESLTEFRVGYNGGIGCLYNIYAGNITLYKGKGVSQVKVKEWTPNYFDLSNEGIYVIKGENVVEWILKLDETITEPGEYCLDIPSSFFTLGNNTANYNNKLTQVLYTIKGEGPEPVKVEITPANGSTLDKLQNFVLTFPEGYDVATTWNGRAVIVEKESGDEVCEVWTNKQYGDAPNEMPMVVAYKGKVIDKGEYIFRIPEHFFYYDEMGFNMNEEQFEFFYTVTGNYDPETDPEKPEKVEVKDLSYSKQIEGCPGLILTLSDNTGGVEVMMGAATVTTNEGTPVINTTMVMPIWDGSGYDILFLQDEDLTESGRYVLNIPAGTFSHVAEDLVIPFTFDAETGTVTLDLSGINSINANAANTTVHTMLGVPVRDTKNLQPGLYIINGKATLVK